MHSRGYSLLETTVVLAIVLLAAALSAPSVLSARDAARARGAADHLASLLHLTRIEALKRQANVAVRFEPEGEDFRFRMYADGNGNGVRTTDIEDGLDRPIRPGERLLHQFPGVRFALDAGVPLVDGEDGGTAEAVRVGRSRMLSFSPTGTSTSGTVYLLGRAGRQLAVRVLGPTGRIRIFEYHRADRVWGPT